MALLFPGNTRNLANGLPAIDNAPWKREIKANGNYIAIGENDHRRETSDDGDALERLDAR
jgi:hypothetical protein